MATLDIAVRLSCAPAGTEPPPFIVAIGGTTSARSSTEKALRIALASAEACGADTLLISGPELELPIYAWDRQERGAAATHLIEAIRRADGIIIGSPGYHGNMSGLVKNALDYVEDLAKDDRPYFHGRAVGAIATAAGWQGAVSTLTALRATVHALRGWNTPLGVAINTAQPLFDEAGHCNDAKVEFSLAEMGRQVAEAAWSMSRAPLRRTLASS